MAKQKTLTELIEGLTWFNDVEKSKEIFRKLNAKAGSTDYIENVEVNGSTMTFTGVGNAFSGDVTLPSGGGGDTYWNEITGDQKDVNLSGFTDGNGTDVKFENIVNEYQTHDGTPIPIVNKVLKLPETTNPLFIGEFISLENLRLAHPTATSGNYAHIDEGVGHDVRRALWDNDDSDWVLGSVVTSSDTPSLTGTDIDTSNNLTGIIYNEETPSTASNFDISAIKTGGYAEVYIDTTGKIEFPTITNLFGTKQQTQSNGFRADAIFKMIVKAKNETDVEYFFVDYIGVIVPTTGLPAPHLLDINPISVVPSTNFQLDIYSDYLSNATTVVLEGQTVNNVRYMLDSNRVPFLRVSGTAGSIEGDFDIILNNGIETVFTNALTVNLGDVFVPAESDWSSIVNGLDVSEKGSAKITGLNLSQGAKWNKEFDWTKDFILRFKFHQSSFGIVESHFGAKHIQLRNVSDDAIIVYAGAWNYENGNVVIRSRNETPNSGKDYLGAGITTYEQVGNWYDSQNIEIRWNSSEGVLRLYNNGVLGYTYVAVLTGNVYMQINALNTIEVTDIKYIELP